MADNKTKRGRADRSKVAGGDYGEWYYLRRKYPQLSDTVIRNAISKAGPGRKQIEVRLQKAAKRKK